MPTPFELPYMTGDFETYSELDVTEVGAYKYSEHPSTEVLSFAYKFNGKTELWAPPRPFPEKIIKHVKNGGIIKAHGAIFEYAIWHNVLIKRMGLDIPVANRWMDTMATCAYRALPLALDKVGGVLDLEIQKDKRGKYLIQKLCKPRKPTKKDKRTRVQDWDLLEELYDYNITDTDAEDLLDRTIGNLPPLEYKLFVLDQIINNRGVQIDVEAVEAAKDIAESISNELNEELYIITDSDVTEATKLPAMKEWIKEQGIEVTSLDKEMVEYYINLPDIPPKVKRVLEIRREVGRSSVKKLDKMLDCMCDDGRIRGLLQYHGASTGRWAGRLIQPHNFPRGTIKDVDSLIDIIKLKDKKALELVYDSPMEAISSSLRSMFIAGPGKKFYIADFKAIEARVLLWLADEKELLEKVHLSDQGKGPDIYCVMAEKIYKRPINSKDHPNERQLGKITELGCGYQMGGPKFQMQAKQDYGVDITLEEANLIVSIYRDEHPHVEELWGRIEGAAIHAVNTKGSWFYKKIGFHYYEDAAGPWLACELPNKRLLWYYKPKIEDVPAPWYTEQNKAMLTKLTYEGRDNKRGGAWGRTASYGGKFVENIIQAIARDIMANAMIRVEELLYYIVLTIHDEVISEVDKAFGSLKEFLRLMSIIPRWAEGCPIAVEGAEVTIYRKM